MSIGNDQKMVAYHKDGATNHLGGFSSRQLHLSGVTFTGSFVTNGLVSRKSRNFSGAFRVTIPFVSSIWRPLETRNFSVTLILFPLQQTRGPALQNKRVGVSRLAFGTRKVFGTSEKRAPEHDKSKYFKMLHNRAIERQKKISASRICSWDF